MQQQTRSFWQRLWKSLLAIGLVVVLAFSHADAALAARGGGRIGGGSFRAPRSYGAPRTYAPSPRGGYYPGGGIGFPFIFPFFFGGGGGLFGILIVFAIASFLMQAFRRAQSDGSMEGSFGSPTISVAKVQVGLLAQARDLQQELNRLALSTNTSSSEGLATVLQETTVALMRHPEYWVYGSASTQKANLGSAEAAFNRLVLTERSKFSGETLSNVNNQIQQAETPAPLPGDGAMQDPGEYIVVTLLVGAEGDLKLPTVNSEATLRQALEQLGGTGRDRLLALEILWTPQKSDDVLTQNDLLVEYPQLQRI